MTDFSSNPVPRFIPTLTEVVDTGLGGLDVEDPLALDIEVTAVESAEALEHLLQAAGYQSNEGWTDVQARTAASLSEQALAELERLENQALLSSVSAHGIHGAEEPFGQAILPSGTDVQEAALALEGNAPAVEAIVVAKAERILSDEFEEQIVHRVMQRVDTMLTDRVSEAINQVIEQQTRSLLPRLREEVEFAVRKSVYEAVADELSDIAEKGAV